MGVCMSLKTYFCTEFCGDQNLKTAKIGICTPLKHDSYFWFVVQPQVAYKNDRIYEWHAKFGENR